MSDSAAIVKAPERESWVQSFVKRAKGEVATVTPKGATPYLSSAGSTVVEVGSGLVVGGLLGAIQAKTGIDASPALLGTGALLSIALAGTHPEAAKYARAAAGQAAAVLAARKAEMFLGGMTPVKSTGPAAASMHGEASDPILRVAASMK
jgi:hypothetical protein